MKWPDRSELLLIVASACLTILAAETILRILVGPSDYSSGRLLNRELPPFKLLPDGPMEFQPDRSEPVGGLTQDGRQLTVGDLWGIFEPDEILGYVPKKNRISSNGWWQSNNIGARARTDTSPEKSAGTTRLLVFGESFAQGSRVRQEDSWPAILEASQSGLEVVNLAVDGYGMAQAFLRFRVLPQKLDYDIALLMFAPHADLWRDINIRRDLGANWWGSFLSMPRFVPSDSGLALIRPFPTFDVLLSGEFPQALQTSLKQHLHAYDRFYDGRVYDLPRVLEHSVIYRLLLQTSHSRRKKALHQSLWNARPGTLADTHSEATMVAREIFRGMRNEVEHEGKRMLLVTIPAHSELRKRASDSSIDGRHKELCGVVASPGLACLSLFDDLSRIPLSELDQGQDGSHYGPEANRRIAQIIRRHLVVTGTIPAETSD